MRVLFTCFLFISLLFSGCSPTKTTANTPDLQLQTAVKSANETEVDAASGIDLASFLRRLPGVSVRGSGPGARVQIRGNSGFNGGSAPLFVVNGTILGTNYSQLFTTIDVNEIKSVRVLKNASETAAYGLQGGNGVLEFTLKN